VKRPQKALNKGGGKKQNGPLKPGPGRAGKVRPMVPLEGAASPMETVVLRNQFFQDGYRRASRLNVLLIIALCLSLGALGADLVLRKPVDRYFLTNQNGAIVPVVAQSDPFVSRSVVLDRAVKGLTSSYTFTFRTWRNELTEASQYFTDRGFDGLLDAFQDQKLLATVEKDFLNSTAVVDGAPVIIQEGVARDGRYSWIVQFYMQHSLQATSQVRTTRYLVEATLVRVPTSQNLNGIAIDQVVTKLRNS